MKSSLVEYKKKENQLYCATFFNEVLRVNTFLTWCEDPSRITNFLKTNHEGSKNEIEEIEGYVTGMCHRIERDGMPIQVICLPFEFNESVDQITTLVHECNHALMAAFRYRKIPLPKDIYYKEFDEENYCYNMDWLFSKCLNALRNKNNHKFKFYSETIIKK